MTSRPQADGAVVDVHVVVIVEGVELGGGVTSIIMPTPPHPPT